MHSKPDTLQPADSAGPGHRQRPGIARIAGRVALLTVLALAFAGYLSPDMRIQWANLMTLCGF